MGKGRWQSGLKSRSLDSAYARQCKRETDVQPIEPYTEIGA